MKKLYNAPEMEIREYLFAETSVLTTSFPEIDSNNNLNNGDEYDIFGN